MALPPPEYSDDRLDYFVRRGAENREKFPKNGIQAAAGTVMATQAS